jgi:hypothetical protein
MSIELNNWTIENFDKSLILKYFSNASLINKFFLLDTEKNYCNVLEKYVYDIANSHCKRLGNSLCKNKQIAYSLRTKYAETNIDKLTHIVTTITYLNDSPVISYFTNMTAEDYMFKNINDSNAIKISFSKENKHISIDNYRFIYGIVEEMKDKVIEDYQLIVNIFDGDKPDFPLFKFDDKESNIYNKHNDLINIKPNNKTNIDISGNESVFEEILYKKNSNELLELIKTTDLVKINYVKSCSVITNNLYSKEEKRFLQRFIDSKIYNESVCKWIIDECEKYASKNNWQESSHDNYVGRELNIANIESILSYVLKSSTSIIDKIINYYCLDKDHIYNITNVFIVKYESSVDKCIELTKDDGFFVVNISLEDTSEKTGLYFDDEITVKLNQGDMIVYSGNSLKKELKINNGVKYSLILFIDIINKNN